MQEKLGAAELSVGVSTFRIYICVTHKNKHNAIYITDISGLTLQGLLTENLLSRHGLPLAFVNTVSRVGHSWREQSS